MARFCPECAHPIDNPDLPFCPKCGTQLPRPSSEIQSSPAEPALSLDSSDQIYIPPVTSDSSSLKDSSPVTEGQTSISSPQKKSSGTWVVICCGGAIGIVVLSALIFISYVALVGSHTISEPVICSEGGVPAIGGDKCCPEGYPYIWDDGKCHSGLQGTSSSSSSSPTSCNAGYHIYSTSQGHCCKAGYPYYFDESCHECAQGQKIAINYIAQCCPNHFPYYYDGTCWTLPKGTKGSASAGSSSSGSSSGSTSGSSSGSAAVSLKSPGSACTATSECIPGYGCLYGICQKWNPTPAGSYEVYCTDCQGKWSGVVINEHPYSLLECKGFYVNCECMHCGTRRISTACVYELTSGFCNYWQG